MSASNVRILALPADETSKKYAQIVALLAAAALSSHKQQPKLASQPATELPSHAVLRVLELPTAGKVYTETNAAVRYLLDKPTTDQNLATKQNAFIEWTETFLEGAIFGEKRGFVDALGEVEKKMIQCKCLVEQSEILSVILFANLHGTLNNSQGDLTSKYPKLSAWFSAFSKQKVIVSAIKQAETLLLGKKKLPTPTEEMLSERKIHSDAVAASPNPKNAKDPSADRNNVLVTSALPYVNNVPHLGNIIGSTLSADVFARYKRLRPGNNVLYICGTDEYGTATETKALEENTTCQALCDKYHVLHKGVYEWFDIGFDHFGRTTTSKQTEIVQDMFHKLRKNNYLSEATMTQLFCEKCSRFLADRYVEGICPKCKYADARGDQCDFCGNLLNASDLIEPRCKLDGNRPIQKDSSHVFLDLDKLQPLCEKWVNEASAKGKWSSNGITITQSWLKEGLKPRCITRDLKWGTPVPLEHMKEKVFYVWFEACMGYPSITAHCADWEKWWKNPDNVKLYQFMGKDNVPFHSVVFPSSQIGTGDNWTKVHHISTTEYLQYEGEKFSKSRNIGVFGDNAKETGVDVSVWRYYLLSIRPEAQDSTFLWNDFIAKNNNELLANLGNFCNRVLKFADTKYAGYVPSYALPISGESEQKLIQDVNALLKDYIDAMENVRIRLGLQIAMHISARGNLYLQDSNVNNALVTNQPEKCAAVIGAAINLIYLISALIHPYMPSVAEDIANQLNAPLPIIPDTFTVDALSPGHRIGKPRHLFSRIPEEKADEWRAKYGGGSAASAANALAASAPKKGARKESKKELKKDGAKGSKEGK